MKILSFQPSSLYQNGGCARVLRRLYENKENEVTSLYVSESLDKPNKGIINEKVIYAFPLHKKWMRWQLRNLSFFLRDKVFYNTTKKKVQEQASEVPYDILHVVNHGAFSTVLCEHQMLAEKSLWVSFHDHFSLCSSFEDTKRLWYAADRRLVISNELGVEYQRLFGKREMEVITDGVTLDEISSPKELGKDKNITIYFAGLLHIDYLPLFKVLAEAMDIVSDEGVELTLILRGATALPFLKRRKFKVDYRIDFISDAAVKTELDNADILYLPIKFSTPAFYLYSLSTKMISYLGGAGSILFHGPADSAACQLLKENEAAVCCTSLSKSDLVVALRTLIHNKTQVSYDAKNLAKNQFLLSDIQDRFWQRK